MEAPAPLAVRTVPRICSVCRHDQRAGIDVALARGSGLRQIAATYRLSKSALSRHQIACVPPKVAKANAERIDRVETSDLLEAMVALQRTTQAQLDRAIADKAKPVDVVKIIKEVRENVGMMGRFLGAFAGEGAKNVDNRVQILALKDMTVDELRALTSALRSGGK